MKQHSGSDVMNYKFDNERPIYIQLVELIKLDIISGKIKSGSKLSSVRDLAQDIKVNPNTIQKALMELEKEGLIYTERTNGKYVTEDKKLIENIRNVYATTLTKTYINDMLNIGYTKEEIKKYISNEGRL